MVDLVARFGRSSVVTPVRGTRSGVRHNAGVNAALVVRIGMGLLGAVHAWWGVWARVAPRDFFDTFPGFGRRWTAAYPPFNEHLVTDLGATFLTLALLLFAGAAWRSGSATTNRSIRTVALIAVGTFSTLHLSFHAGHQGDLGGDRMAGDYGLSLLTLVLGVLVPAGLLVIDRVRPAPAPAGR